MRYYELFEAIRLKKAIYYRKRWNPELYKNIFTDWKGMKDKNDIVLYHQNVHYGTPDEQFTKILDNWINEINGPDKIGLYCINPRLYDDGSEKKIYFNMDKINDEDTQLSLVIYDPDLIGLINNPSEKIKLAAVTHDGLEVQYIENPSEEIQLAAIKQNPYAFKYIDNPTESAKLLISSMEGKIEYKQRLYRT